MSLEIKDIEKMIETCQVIVESCDKPFVWEDEGTYEKGSYKKPFNLFFPHPMIDNELNLLFEKFSGSTHLYDQIKVLFTLDEEWYEYGTYGLDRDFTCTFSRFTLKPVYADQVKAYFTRRLSELQKTRNEMEA